MASKFIGGNEVTLKAAGAIFADGDGGWFDLDWAEQAEVEVDGGPHAGDDCEVYVEAANEEGQTATIASYTITTGSDGFVGIVSLGGFPGATRLRCRWVKPSGATNFSCTLRETRDGLPVTPTP